MSGPDPPTRRSFFTSTHAAEHLCDHVLTRPESHDWAVVLAGYRDLVSPTNDGDLRRVAASLFPGPACPEARRLLDLYLGAILQNIEDAIRLGFWWEQRQGKYQEWFGLGLDGVYVIWDREVIKTSYFPGVDTFTPAAEVSRSENPLPRRDPATQLRPPPPDSPRRRYKLFTYSHYFVSKRCYAEAYDKSEVHQAGGNVFVDPTDPPKLGKWQRWMGTRPT